MQQRLDFQQILSSPTDAYEEGLRFFMGKGLLNNALRRLASDLEEHGIDYNVIGAIALNQHGYRRFTEDIDLLLTKDGLNKFREQLVGFGYRPAFEGSTKQFRTSEENVPVEVIIAGEYPGDGLPKAIAFPHRLFETSSLSCRKLSKRPGANSSAAIAVRNLRC